MESRRVEKFKRVVSRRQPDLTVIMENVWDPHNVGAVLRTCDSVGITEIYVLNTERELVKNQLVVGKRSSGGATKWIDVNYFTDAEACFSKVKEKYGRVIGTHLSEDAVGLYELDLTEPVALLFGNEHLGITPQSLEFCDGNFIIPQVGMVESLNISVACAVTLYETYRQRKVKGFYDENLRMTEVQQSGLYEKYEGRHVARMKPKRTFKRQA